MGIEAVIQGQIESSEDNLVVQLDFILQQLNSEEVNEGEYDSGDDDDDDGSTDDAEEDDSEDLMIADASEGESLTDSGGVTGEDLLRRDYGGTISSQGPSHSSSGTLGGTLTATYGRMSSQTQCAFQRVCITVCVGSSERRVIRTRPSLIRSVYSIYRQPVSKTVRRK